MEDSRIKLTLSALSQSLVLRGRLIFRSVNSFAQLRLYIQSTYTLRTPKHCCVVTGCVLGRLWPQLKVAEDICHANSPIVFGIPAADDAVKTLERCLASEKSVDGLVDLDAVKEIWRIYFAVLAFYFPIF